MIRKSALLAALAAFTLATSQASADTFVRIVSGPAGGSWYPLGAKMAEILEKEVDGISTSNGPGGGVGNVKDVNNKEAEIGWSYGHTAFNGFSGKGAFDKAHPDVRHLATLYPAGLQTVVPNDSKVQSFADLKNKNISPGKTQWSGFAAFKLVAGKYGFTVDDVKKAGGTVHHVSYSDSVGLMKDGHIEAFTALTSVPQASLLDLEFNPGVRFLPLEEDVLKDILSENPGYVRLEVTNEHYKSVKTPVPILGAVTNLVVHKDVPDDIVYGITKAIWDNHAEFAKLKDIWNSVKLENALLGAAVPVHPGAQRYYDEMGVAAQ